MNATQGKLQPYGRYRGPRLSKSSLHSPTFSHTHYHIVHTLTQQERCIITHAMPTIPFLSTNHTFLTLTTPPLHTDIPTRPVVVGWRGSSRLYQLDLSCHALHHTDIIGMVSTQNPGKSEPSVLNPSSSRRSNSKPGI